VVRVRAGGSPLPLGVLVKIYSLTTAIEFTEGTRDQGQARFEAVPIGTYRLEIRAPGFLPYTEDVEIMMPNMTTTLHVELRSEGSPGASPGAVGPPILSPKASKELNLAVEAMRMNNFSRAEEYLKKVIKMAPGHPDAFYLWSLILQQKKQFAAAREQLETALRLYPNHVPALISLGGLNYQEQKYNAAVAVLERAVQLDPNSWQARETLAAACFEQSEFAKAIEHARRALELNRGKTPEMHYILGTSLLRTAEFERGREELRAFLDKAANHPRAARAREELAALETPAPKASGSEAAFRPEPASPAAPPPATSTAPPQPLVTPELVVPVPKRWPLPPVDEAVPEFRAGATCSLPTVLAAAGRKVQILAKNLEQITATESIDTVESDALGNRRLTDPRRFHYVVAISEVRPGMLSVDEYRKQVSAGEPKTYGLETHGLFALPIVFHPYYSKDFVFRCEGLTQWEGVPAWSVYFEQRKDRPSRIRSYRLRNGRFAVKIKGRAWVARESSEILRMEANLLAPMKEIKLEHEHLVINYQPVEFDSRKGKLWLPSNAEYFAHFRGRIFHYRHTLTDYLVFNVDFTDKQKAPKVEEPKQDPPQK
jgi:tetratricopeptide (TPR) repeat protein